MNLKLDRIRTFITVVESHGFTTAAKRLKLSVPAVSKQIRELESDVKTLLIERTTRRISLTESGEIYYEQCKRLMDEVLETEGIVDRWNLAPAGVLRVFVARYFGEEVILPYLKEFLNLYPKLRLDLEFGERVPDPRQESIDVIFGISMAGPDLWIQKRIAETRYVYCASPHYLRTYGIPKKPSDLIRHRYLTHKMRKPENILEFYTGERIKIVPFLSLNDTGALLEASIQGLGIVQLHHYVVKSALESGALTEILSRFVKTKIPVFLYYPPHRFLQSKIRKFIEFFSQKMSIQK